MATRLDPPSAGARDIVATLVRLTTLLNEMSSRTFARRAAAMRVIRRSTVRLAASRDAQDLARIAPVLLVELAHFDKALCWRVDGPALLPVSAAFADGMTPSRHVLQSAFASPISLDRLEVESCVVYGAHRAAVGTCGEGRPLAPLLGTTSYAVAVIRSGKDPRALLHAAHRDVHADDLDRELLWSFAELCTALMQRHAVSGQLARRNDTVRALTHSLADAEDRSPTLAPTPSDGLTPADEASDQTIAATLGSLTRREREVCKVLLSGAANSEIAQALVIADDTVKSHVSSILHKLGVSSRAQAIAKYR